MSLQKFCMTSLSWRQLSQCLYICHSWCPKSPRLHSGIENILQDSLGDALEKHRRISSSRISRSLKFCKHLSQCWRMSFLTSIDSIQDRRKSSKTPWRKLSRHIEESLPPVHQVEWNIAHKLLVYTYIKWPRSHSGINNSIQDILDWTMFLRCIGESPLPVDLEAWKSLHSFLDFYICHSLCSKSFSLHSVVKDIPQDSSKDALEIHRRISLSSIFGSLKFCTQRPYMTS